MFLAGILSRKCIGFPNRLWVNNDNFPVRFRIWSFLFSRSATSRSIETHSSSPIFGNRFIFHLLDSGYRRACPALQLEWRVRFLIRQKLADLSSRNCSSLFECDQVADLIYRILMISLIIYVILVILCVMTPKWRRTKSLNEEE